MALFGPQARLERCLWWQELIHWPNGASAENRASCYDKVFGRSAAPGGVQPQRLSTDAPIVAKNDLLYLALVALLLFLVYKYWK